jgi:hypothetical protein
MKINDEVKASGMCIPREPVMVEAGNTPICDIPSEWSAERYIPFRLSR